MNEFQIAGGLIILIAAAMCVPVLIVCTRKPVIHPRRQHIDVLIETALIEGELAHSPTPIFDALVADVCTAAVANFDDEWKELA